MDTGSLVEIGSARRAKPFAIWFANRANRDFHGQVLTNEGSQIDEAILWEKKPLFFHVTFIQRVQLFNFS